MMKPGSKLFYSYLFFLTVYSAFTLMPDPEPAVLAQYDVSVTGLRIIYVTIIALLAVIWFAGFYGYAKLRAYCQLIQGDKDGRHVAKLTKGLFLLVMWLPVSSVISVVLNYFAAKHPEWLAEITTINRYINLLLPFVGFIFISLGARRLSDMVKQRPSYRATNLLAIFLIGISVLYMHLVETTAERGEVYYLPLWVVLLTRVAPYIYMWYIGLQATYDLYLYYRKVDGLVYRKSWRLLTLGVGWLVVTSVVFQYITTTSEHLSELSIYWILAIVYSLLLVLSIGFVLIARGTRKLRKIEEV